MKFTRKNKCPRCKLPHNGTTSCQYCGHVLSKKKEPTKTIRNKLKDIIGSLSKHQIFPAKKPKITDHGGTRKGTDRRKYEYMHYPAERRAGKDRRRKMDRRGQEARKKN